MRPLCPCLSTFPSKFLPVSHAAEVGKLVANHLQQHGDHSGPLTEEGLQFTDSGDESDDSGLHELVYGSNSGS